MNRKDKYFIPLVLLVLSDIVVFFSCFVAAYFVRFYTYVNTMFYKPVPDFNYYFYLAIIISLYSVIIFYHFGFYDRRIGLDRNVSNGATILAIVVTYIFIMALLFNYRGFSFSRSTVGLAIPITCTGVVVAHDLLKKIQYYFLKKGIVFFKTVLVGPASYCEEVNKKLQEHHGSLFQVLGYITTAKDEPASENPLLPCLGTKKHLSKILNKEKIDHAIIAMPAEEHQKIVQMMKTCANKGITYRVIPELYDYICRHIIIDEENTAVPPILFSESPLKLSNYGLLTKRLMDIVISSMALTILGPVMFIVA